MSHWDFGRAPAEQHDEASSADGDFPYGPGEVTYRAAAEDGWDTRDARDIRDEDEDEDAWPYPITYERDWTEPVPPSPSADTHDAYDTQDTPDDPYDPYEIWPAAPAPDSLFADGPRGWPPPPRAAIRAPRSWPGRPGRRWLIIGGIALAAAAVGGTAVALAGGHPGTTAAARPAARATAAPSVPPAPGTRGTPGTRPTTASSAAAMGTPPLTLTQARGVLAGYTAGNNRANATRSAGRLAAVETGSSYAIDAALYLTGRASGAAPFPAFAPASAVYYLPRSEPAAGPRWFVARVANAFASRPATVTSVEYLLFLQATPGGPWLNAIEPYLLPAAGAPRIMVGGDGLATAVAPAATALAVAPARLPKVTAGSFDGSGPVVIPAGLADRADQRSWQQKAPSLTITDRHAPATAGQAFALRTTDGGALVFYTVAATVTITPPAGSVFHLGIPGLQSSAQPLRRVELQYRDQFAAYDPPAGAGLGPPRVLADYSGITRRM